MKLTVIIPMYNEEKIILDTASTLSEFMRREFDSYEVIFFDDGSTDNCRAAVDELRLPCVRVLGTKENHGKGSAVRRAMLEANGDIRIFTDADLAYGTDPIKKAYEAITSDEETDILIGSRTLSKDGYDGYTFIRKVMSKLYIRILCKVGGFKLSDSQCGIKAFRGEVAQSIFSECKVDGFAFDFEVILRSIKANKTIKEMPVKVINHRASSVRPVRDAFRMLRDLGCIKKNINNEK